MTRDVLRRDVPTPRGREHVREVVADGDARATVLLVHGNCSSSAFFDPLLRALPAAVRGVAVALRGYGAAEPRPPAPVGGCAVWSASWPAEPGPVRPSRGARTR